MYSFEYPNGLDVGRVCVEMSLKPFRKLSDDYIGGVCCELFDQWRELIRKASSLSVLLWVGDGSEILDFRGDLSDEIEWAMYLGQAVQAEPPPEYDPDRKGLHGRPYYYMENPPVIKYIDLKRIISELKRVGKEITGLDVTVGATFDPGPEFVRSSFKYRRHTEILSGIMGTSAEESFGKPVVKNWVHCTATLCGDKVDYAAFKGGIPDGLSFGTFLGAQYRMLSEAVGYDYIWFSNGFGYSRDSWNWTGECFDGNTFSMEKSEKTKGQILKFWQDFVEACPGVRIETRGSNLSTAMDIAAHGTPLESIYRYIPIAPPNSPWAAIDAQFGLELTGYMSHIAIDCPEGYLFRYYTHDPWWVNSPWFDRYNRCPHDIYMPLSIARLDQGLQIKRPFGINFLTADDSFGHMPRRCPVEVTPHLLDAYSHYPDAPGLVTWIYPFDHYHSIASQNRRMGEVLFGDWYISSAIDAGMPLNTVIADRFFPASAEKIAGKSVIVTVVPDAGGEQEQAVISALQNGADVLLYGSASYASDKMLALLGLVRADPIEGSFTMHSRLRMDNVENGRFSDILIHDANLSGGGLDMTASGKTELCVTAKSEEGNRAYAVYNHSALNGRLAWVRGSFPSPGCASDRLPQPFLPSENAMPGVYLRMMLQKFGIALNFDLYAPDEKYPFVLCTKNNGAIFINSYSPDTMAKMHVSLADGAPVMTGTDCLVEDSCAEYTLPRWQHGECRVFVKQAAKSRVRCSVSPSVHPGTDRRICIDGLVNADIVFCRQPDSAVRMVNSQLPNKRDDSDKFLESNIEMIELGNNRLSARNITGSLMISWVTGDACPLVPLEW